ncbi:tRNA lysidine(34) synthetase TilS [Caldanaerobius polysaccharolyticus]|uniref:tRNA lysidine(34) synthetase TilS n=1 Tax=Caldanaerobius polysaccharolyticus TaxID=44256 RepID=UPI00047C1EE8|nr:tRNA lysidine(34) synthetase TilS [Caldanaerobius polysaccharolyticus]
MLAEDTIKKYNMIRHGDKIIVAVSGGPDSVCLLHVLFRMRDNYDLSLIVAHVNHCLRGTQAEEDMRFVQKMACDLGLPFYAKVEDVAKIAADTGMSVEQAGRHVRYAFFRQLKEQLKADKIAVAHNMDDQAETVLLHLLRGAGVQGLTGMSPVSGDIIRPLIETPRRDIEAYIEENGLEYRVDHTNFQTHYFRNRIRIELIPYLKDHFNKNIAEALVQAADILREEDAYVQKNVLEIYKKICFKDKSGVQVELSEFERQDLAVKRRLIRKMVEDVKGNNLNLEFKHIEYIMEFIKRGQTGERVDIPGGICVGLQYGKIRVFSVAPVSKAPDFCYPLVIPGTTRISELNASVRAEVVADIQPDFKNRYRAYLDYDQIPDNLVVRSRRPGDYIIPFGMNGHKKLKEYFIDAKVPSEVRDKIPLVASGSEIVWIVGHRINGKYKVTDKTRRFLVLIYEGGYNDAGEGYFGNINR